jgi:hypothetical protein
MAYRPSERSQKKAYRHFGFALNRMETAPNRFKSICRRVTVPAHHRKFVWHVLFADIALQNRCRHLIVCSSLAIDRGTFFSRPQQRKGEAMISQTSSTDNGRIELCMPVLSMYEQRMHVLELTVQLLVVRTSRGDYWAEGIHDVEQLLAALPMPTTEFAAANGHLQNARSYCQQEEFGAAAFELRALRGYVQRM